MTEGTEILLALTLTWLLGMAIALAFSSRARHARGGLPHQGSSASTKVTLILLWEETVHALRVLWPGRFLLLVAVELALAFLAAVTEMFWIVLVTPLVLFAAVLLLMPHGYWTRGRARRHPPPSGE